MQSYEKYHYFSKNSKQMTEARDMVKLALPFSLGIASISFLPLSLKSLGLISSITSIVIVLMLINIIHQNLENKAKILVIYAVVLLAGIFVRSNHEILKISSGDMSILKEFASENIGFGMQMRIDRTPFKNQETNALLKALLTGNRRDLEKDTLTAFRSSGASHILALSGMHLGIIFLFISKILSLAGGRPSARIMRSIISIIVCTSYSLATGASPSIMRALTFIILRETSFLLHREADMKNTLAASLFLQLLISPADINSVGFQLSYSAIAGIAYIYPHLNNLWPVKGQKRPPMKILWDAASLSISCQLTTFPLAWFYFKTFPQYFILTNLISFPLVSLLIPCALITVTLSGIGICPDFMIWITETLSTTLCDGLEIIASI